MDVSADIENHDPVGTGDGITKRAGAGIIEIRDVIDGRSRGVACAGGHRSEALCFAESAQLSFHAGWPNKTERSEYQCRPAIDVSENHAPLNSSCPRESTLPSDEERS